MPPFVENGALGALNAGEAVEGVVGRDADNQDGTTISFRTFGILR